MIEKEKIIRLIFDVIDIINEDLPGESRLNKSPDTALGGPNTKLDSLGFVNFLVTAEQKIEEEFDLTIALATEEALSQKENNPFRSVDSLAGYMISLMQKASKG